ncbi:MULTISPECIES: ABC transporter ATP-binding protein [Fusobacterium]|jgi:ATP-binding cassette subfamily B protein|uniref:ABC transporter ATP-binding protein n=1 Tax=Fusobacterium varium ATCC 27725 TaxID=469618 RepID=A0ABN5JGZ4_FUSVA|nr:MULTISPECIES: ABC transporter ATP-binding protein [Fusobacterium]AVQ31391.1 ABC transporter ATP-binding protein [Fusobacterium varium ATCC 27725]EES62717.1 ABC transporter, ATP-binding protein [Fusobacterium varium ATCC 27725]MCF0170201.1 ABC transporter ATP-binding protein [Fusobacterium varium]MCF2673007.1 ABC transporter ATP-binding protein [Fusobacterium varium]MCI6034133.1 ABC transporter ATP-binding protein/permease [Fusobacterium varium]
MIGKLNIFKNKSLNTFLRYSLKYKWVMTAVVFTSAVSSAMGAVPAWLSKYLIDDVLVNKNAKMMALVIGGIFVSTILKVVTGYFSSISSNYVTETIKRDIKIDVYSHLQKLPMSYFKRNKLGDVMARLSGDSATLGRIGFIIFDMFKEFLTVVALTFRMFQVDYILALVALIVMPLIISTVKKYTKKIRKSGRIRQDTSGAVTAFIQETLSGIFVIKAFNNSDEMIEKYKVISKDEFEKSYKSTKIKAKVSPINEVITTIMVLLVASYGGYQIIVLKSMTAGDLISFVTALGLMSQPLKRLISKNNDLQEALPSADRVIEILDVPLEQDYFGEEKELKSEIKDIKFENLSFHYDDSPELILKNINLNVKAGEVIALVGKSGSGKTTLVNLIPRFYEVTEGAIKVNGIDIKNISLKKYRDYIGIVPQESFLFSGSISENIAFGKNGVTEDEIINAAKMANAYDFIMELPNKFETEVGERGVLLSGGQKQRIAIARALIQNPEIMILDEATSALDTESERLVQDALDKLMVNRTTFVIAHRLSTIINADKIVVMENGEIKEIGTHQELLEFKGLYKHFYEIQFGKKEKVKEEVLA